MATAAGPKIVEVAEQIVADIQRRKLRPGDAYLDTATTARMLRVSGSTVNRAFQLLAQRGVVQRRQRLGTIVSDVRMSSSAHPLRRVHLLVREDHLQAEGLWSDGVLLGLQSVLPGVELQFNFRPELDEAQYVERLIHEILSNRQQAGLVLLRASVVTQRLVAASGLPAVVSGMLQPSIDNLPSIDRDQHQIGDLLAQYLLKSRCRTFLIFLRERVTTGDHLMLDAALATLGQGGIDMNRIRIRCLPNDAQAIEAAAGDVLSTSRGRVGCLCRSEALARGVAAAASNLQSLRGKPVIAVADAAGVQRGAASFPTIEPIVGAEAWGAALGKMLATTARGQRPDPYRQIIPVRLVLPELARR